MIKNIYRQASIFVYVEIVISFVLLSVLGYFSSQVGSLWENYKTQMIFSLFFVFTFVTIRSLWRYYSLTITLNIEEMRVKEGILNTRVKEIAFHKINLVTVTQTLLGKIFNFGDLQINTGGDEVEVLFKNVQDPEEIRGKINEKRNLL